MDKKPQIIMVSWVDPHSVDEWVARKELCLLECIVYSVGILVRDTDSVIALSLNYQEQESGEVDLSCIMIIPKKCIRHITVISANFYDLLPDPPYAQDPDKGA